MHELEFRLEPSRYFLCLLSMVFIFSEGIVLWLPVHSVIKGTILLFTAMYFAYVLVQHGLLRNKKSILGIRYAQNGFRLQMHQGTSPAKLCGDSTVTSLAMVLRFKLDGFFCKQSCVIMRDSLPAQQYQHLLVLLKMGR